MSLWAWGLQTWENWAREAKAGGSPGRPKAEPTLKELLSSVFGNMKTHLQHLPEGLLLKFPSPSCQSKGLTSTWRWPHLMWVIETPVVRAYFGERQCQRPELKMHLRSKDAPEAQVQNDLLKSTLFGWKTALHHALVFVLSLLIQVIKCLFTV